jgi:acyl-CoA thioester hydrolase
MGRPFVHSVRVRYAECDRQGVVFNAHYFAYFDLAMTELWRSALGHYDAMIERGIDMVVAEAQARFLDSARFDDEIDLHVAVERLGTTGSTTRHRVMRSSDVLVDGVLRHVFVEPETLEKKPIPDWLRAALEPYCVTPPAVRP